MYSRVQAKANAALSRPRRGPPHHSKLIPPVAKMRGLGIGEGPCRHSTLIPDSIKNIPNSKQNENLNLFQKNNTYSDSSDS